MQVHRFGTERNTDTEEEEHAVLFWDRNSTSPKYMGHVKEEIWRPLYTSSCSCLRDRYRLWRWQRQLLLIHHPLPFADCRPQLFREGASNFSSKHACRGRVFPAFRYSQPFFLSLHDTIMPTLFPEVLQLFLPEFQCFGRMSSGTRHDQDQTLVFLQKHQLAFSLSEAWPPVQIWFLRCAARLHSLLAPASDFRVPVVCFRHLIEFTYWESKAFFSCSFFREAHGSPLSTEQSREY